MKQLQLSRTATYAVRATIQLAKSENSRPIPCSKLAADGKMPEWFLLQILRNLVTHGILRSTRGVEGGYSLTRPPREISLLDVIEAIEGPMDAEVPFEETVPEGSYAKLQDALHDVASTARRQLEAVKFSQLIVPEPTTSPEPATLAEPTPDSNSAASS